MEYTYHDLKHKKVAELREIAAGLEHEAVQGYTQMNKDHLLTAICTALHIELHEHHEVIGLDKKKIKARIRELKVKRDKAIEDKDHKALKLVRKDIKSMKNRLRRAMV